MRKFQSAQRATLLGAHIGLHGTCVRCTNQPIPQRTAIVHNYRSRTTQPALCNAHTHTHTRQTHNNILLSIQTRHHTARNLLLIVSGARFEYNDIERYWKPKQRSRNTLATTTKNNADQGIQFTLDYRHLSSLSM